MKHYVKDNSIDVVVTSPPYNMGKDGNTYMDYVPKHEYLSWLGQVGRQIKRVLKEDGLLFLNIGNRPKDQWLAWGVANTIRKDFTLLNVFHWIKSIAISKQDTGKRLLPDNPSYGHICKRIIKLDIDIKRGKMADGL